MNKLIFSSLTGIVVAGIFGIMVIANIPNLIVQFEWIIANKNEKLVSLSDYYYEYNSDYSNNVLWRSGFININGAVTKALNVRSMYSSQYINVADNGYIVGWYSENDTVYETSQLIDFKKYLDRKGIRLLYVNNPIKYFDDRFTLEQFGKKSYGNTNADKLLDNLNSADITTIDMRQVMKNNNLDSFEMFYKTDHHWTVPAGFLCAKSMVSELNENYGYNIDFELYGESNMEYIEFKDAWLGEQGRRVAASYVGLDDFIEIKPLYDTSFTVYSNGAELASGDFTSIMVNENVYAPYSSGDHDVYNGSSWHYSYAPFSIAGAQIINNNVSDGKILYLGDSYSYVVVPFLALGVHEVDSYIMRNVEGSIRETIENGDYDTVIICYASSMIGSHTDASNANYKLFQLD